MSDFLIVYYSRTGKTRMVAEKLAELLDADIEEIREQKDRSGMIGFLAAGMDALLKKPAELTNAPNPGRHKVILLGAPVWTWGLPPAVRDYVRQVDLAGRKVCAFCTSICVKGKGAFNALNRALPEPLAETFRCPGPKAGDAELDPQLQTWAAKVKGLVQGSRRD